MKNRHECRRLLGKMVLTSRQLMIFRYAYDGSWDITESLLEWKPFYLYTERYPIFADMFRSAILYREKYEIGY